MCRALNFVREAGSRTTWPPEREQQIPAFLRSSLDRRWLARSRLFRRHVIVSTACLMADPDAPSSTTTSHGAPGGAVAGLTGTAQVTLVGPGLTFVTTTGGVPSLLIMTRLMAPRL